MRYCPQIRPLRLIRPIGPIFLLAALCFPRQLHAQRSQPLYQITSGAAAGDLVGTRVGIPAGMTLELKAGSTLTLPAFTEYSDATNLTVLANTTAAEMLVTSKTTGSTAAFTPGSWTMTLKARK
jgi:hypothetical protein